MLSEFKKAWKESGEQARTSRERDRQERKEKRRREAFPGKYSKMLYQIFWKNFLYNWKDYVLLLVCGIIMSAITFALLGSYQAMSELHSNEGTFYLFGNVGEGIQRIVVNAMFPLGSCAIFLLVYVLLFYLKKRMLSYSIFVTLGIREKVLYAAIAIEIVAGILLSILLGCLLGNVLMHLIYRGMYFLLGETVSFSPVTFSIYRNTILIIIAIYALTFLDMVFVTDFNPISANARNVQSERMPKKRLKVFIITGIVLITGSWLLYTRIWSFEKVSLIGVLCIGIYLLLRYGGAAYLRKEKQGKKYLAKLIDRNHLYHESLRTALYLIGLIIIHLCAVFYFTFPTVSAVVAEEPEPLFPYDFMCMADDEDDMFFQELNDKYGAEIISYPMVRAVAVDRTQKVESRPCHLPQGQHIGISETTYHELKKALNPDCQAEPLGLDDGEEKIGVVHQQDKSVKAQPIDWTSFFKIRPYIHVGLPCKAFIIDSLRVSGSGGLVWAG